MSTMEERIAALERTVTGPKGHTEKLASIEKWMASIDDSLKTLVTIAKTLKWVGYVALGIWFFVKTGDFSKVIELFRMGP